MQCAMPEYLIRLHGEGTVFVVTAGLHRITTLDGFPSSYYGMEG